MSLNTAHMGKNVYIHMGEVIVLFAENVSIDFSNTPGPEFKGKKTGKAYLTTHRLIFQNKSEKDPMQSFSFPYVSISDLGLEQPVFGANCITGVVLAQQNGNWTGEAKFKMSFKNGGAIEFGQAIIRLTSFAKKHVPQGPPPAYMPPTGPSFPAPPPAYHADPSGYYGWMPPTAVFPSAPPQNTVYMVDSPPPYSGIYGLQASPYAGATCPPQDAKAAEAAQSAYYDPNKPQYAYVPPPAYYEHPPSYQEAVGKKTQ